MNKLLKTLLIIAAVAVLQGCASIVSKTSWPLTINSNPNGAKVEITKSNGQMAYEGTTPATISLKSGNGYFKHQIYTVKLTLDGYQEKTIKISCKINGWYFGNIALGGLIGMVIVDPLTGAMYRLDTENINETLDKANTASARTLQIINLNDVPQELRGKLVSIR